MTRQGLAAVRRDRNGIVVAEGGCLFVLERLSDARARGAKIYGEVVGYAMNSDACDFVLPDPVRQAECIQLACGGPGSNPAESTSSARTPRGPPAATPGRGPCGGSSPAAAAPVQQHQEFHRARDGGRRALEMAGNLRRWTTACATPRSIWTASPPIAGCRAWWPTNPANGRVRYHPQQLVWNVGHQFGRHRKRSLTVAYSPNSRRCTHDG